LIGSLFFLSKKWKVYNIEQNGTIVEMKIVKLPDYCGLTRGKYYMDVSYQGDFFTKRIPVGFCDTMKIGQSIKMKYIAGEESILFPDEKALGDLVAIAIIIVVAIVSIVYGIDSKRRTI